MDMDLKQAMGEIADGRDLTREAAHAVFLRVLCGDVPESEIAGLLGALSGKGESVSELVGAAQAMRDTCVRVKCENDCIDTCGTGGDGISTFNVSTAAGIIASAAGATVAKHGNRSTTRVSGSTEVLGELGIDTDSPVDRVERSLAEARIGYLNARNLHPGMQYVAPVRASIPGRTIFNLLGPLANPCGAKRQLLGVSSPELIPAMCEALLTLGATHAWVVHGCGGLCDVTISGETFVGEVLGGRIRHFEICPEDGGVPRGTVDELRVSSPAESAQVVLGVLGGEPGTTRHHTLLNAGAALVISGHAKDIAEGVERAIGAVDSGAGMKTLEAWRNCCGTM
jgi:anthranilate phosphoribosyltransferase